MSILLEILLWLAATLGELLLELVFELLAEFGLRSLGAPFRPAREISPWVAAPGYLIYGALAGALSVWLFPAPLLVAKWAQIANLAITPLAAGGVMALLGAWRRRRGQPLLRLDRFSYGALFALAMVLVRYVFAEPQ